MTERRRDPRAQPGEPEARLPDPREITPGVRELDHTADVGLVVTATEPAELFRRAGLGMARLMRGSEPTQRRRRAGSGRAAERVVELRSDALDLLLVSWLGELLYLDEAEGFVFEDARFSELGEGGLRATVTGRFEPEAPERQLKGVTYHGLRLEPVAGGWQARVIFDI